MSARRLFSIVESPMHPDFSALYQRLDIKESRFGSMRKAISALKTQTPDLVVAEFMYGYGNNYAGVNVSNLDVFLYSLQKYSRDTGIVVLVEKHEHQYVEKLAALFPLRAVLTYPVREKDIEPFLGNSVVSGP
jgi:hypothetical protein